MIGRLLAFSVKGRWIVVALTLLVTVFGAWQLTRLPIDAVPDITNKQVQINSAAPALSPVEMEKRVTFPIETALAGLPGLKTTRSISRNGFSQVMAIFTEKTDLYFARQQVTERLTQARDSLPGGVQPQIGPATTGLGEIFFYSVDFTRPAKGPPVQDGKPGWQGDGAYLTPEGDRLADPVSQAAYLRTVQDWIIRPQLRGVLGVALRAHGARERHGRRGPEAARHRGDRRPDHGDGSDAVGAPSNGDRHLSHHREAQAADTSTFAACGPTVARGPDPPVGRGDRRTPGAERASAFGKHAELRFRRVGARPAGTWWVDLASTRSRTAPSAKRASMSRHVISTSSAPPPPATYSQAVKAAGLIFVSGTAPIDPATGKLIEGDAAAQTGQCLRNIQAILQSAGSSLDKAVSATLILAEEDDFAVVNQEWLRWFPADPPARQGAKLPVKVPGLKVSIAVIAEA